MGGLKLFRTMQEMTQTELAIKIGITQASVAQFESGIRKPNSKTIAKLAKALRVTPESISGVLVYITEKIKTELKDLTITERNKVLEYIHFLKYRHKG